ncbi:CesT family type III secretion system chaperone [Pseudomonas shahriarae]|uniref:CesT family type III secretion system chaperone n=1 Tax=Pseudomonas shahriarae TaxID=2745512 RepID=UPI0023613B8E|nr:CesT family type III secretion system chaperone [Pseudomonas shahriarae]MDD0980843.1 CesT family type III secretion system chaperone [Pseudomonas shahriarae]
MDALIARWMNDQTEHISLMEGNDEIVLRRSGPVLLLSVQLTQERPDKSSLQNWMRLGCASLNHFQGALAQSPESGALWLRQQLISGCSPEQLCNTLETLLNQRDTWRAMIKRLAKPNLKHKPLSLRSLPY